jgi:hypothetical protein
VKLVRWMNICGLLTRVRYRAAQTKPSTRPWLKVKVCRNPTKLCVFETTCVHAIIRLLSTPIRTSRQRVTFEAYEGKTTLTST